MIPGTMERLIRTSNGPLAVLFACLLLQNRNKTYFTEEEISFIMERTEKTIRGHMRQLAEIGYITRTRHGWTLTVLGRQQLLEVSQFQLAPGENEPVKITGGEDAGEESTGKNYRCGTIDPGKPVKITGENPVVVVFNKDLKDFKDLNKQQQHLSDEPVKITGEIDRILLIGRKICDSADMILDAPIWPSKVLAWLEKYEDRRQYHPENKIQGLSILCGWIAQLHKQPPSNIRSSLASIVAADVTYGRLPQRKYLEKYWQSFDRKFCTELFAVTGCLACWQDIVNCTCEDGGIKANMEWYREYGLYY
jgi:hypothetical protein